LDVASEYQKQYRHMIIFQEESLPYLLYDRQLAQDLEDGTLVAVTSRLIADDECVKFRWCTAHHYLFPTNLLICSYTSSCAKCKEKRTRRIEFRSAQESGPGIHDSGASSSSNHPHCNRLHVGDDQPKSQNPTTHSNNSNSKNLKNEPQPSTSSFPIPMLLPNMMLPMPAFVVNPYQPQQMGLIFLKDPSSLMPQQQPTGSSNKGSVPVPMPVPGGIFVQVPTPRYHPKLDRGDRGDRGVQQDHLHEIEADYDEYREIEKAVLYHLHKSPQKKRRRYRHAED